MKLPEIPSNFNALIPVLALITNKELKPLTNSLVDSIASALQLGQIECENRDETVGCLKILHEMGVIKLIKKRELTGVSYLIGNLYNGK